MANLVIKEVSKHYGEVRALDDVSIDVEEGEFVVLVGPSGCGKSTLLHAIAGLHEITLGSIVIGGRDVTNLPAREREVAMVFQSYALYPTMTVRDNIAFPLKMRKWSKQQITAKLNEVAEMLQIHQLLDRFPRDLSGGQRQRVAIGRALVRDADLFLFDEPLSNLDAALRTGLRAEIKRLHKTINQTMVYVTHDQIEAMTLATKIVILDKGKVQQIGSPSKIYHDPANLFVARFIGTPAISLLKGRIEFRDGNCFFVGKTGTFKLPKKIDMKGDQSAAIFMALRPEAIQVSGDPESSQAIVDLVEPTGPEDILTLSIGDDTVIVPAETGVANNAATVGLKFDLKQVMIFRQEDGRRLL